MLYEKYSGQEMRGLVSMQLLVALNIFLGGEIEISGAAMSELFHNLSWQALTNDNDRHQIEFNAISVLVQSIIQRIQRLIMTNRREAKRVEDMLLEKMLKKEVEDYQTDINKVEENAVEDIINNVETDYATPSPSPFASTEEEIESDEKEENKEYLKTQLAIRARDFETIRNINAEKQVDLIKSFMDPLEGQYANDSITSADYNRSEHNESQLPQVDPNVLK